MPLVDIDLITNIAIVNNYEDVNVSTSDGPIRLLETDSTYRLVVVGETSILFTLLEIDKSLTSGEVDSLTPINKIVDKRT